MTIQTKLLNYDCDGVRLEGYLAWDDSIDTAPAIAVSHAWGGRGEFEESKALALAEMGFVGFAIDMYGEGKQGNNPEENEALMTPLLANRDLLGRRIEKAIETLRDQSQVDSSKIAAMGYCFGGLCVLDLARRGSDVAGVISFHGLFTPPNDEVRPISTKILCLHGYQDPMALPESVVALGEEMTKAGADWQLYAYGNALHSFTNPAANDRDFGTVYDADADRRSWLALANFLEEIF